MPIVLRGCPQSCVRTVVSPECANEWNQSCDELSSYSVEKRAVAMVLQAMAVIVESAIAGPLMLLQDKTASSLPRADPVACLRPAMVEPPA